MYEAMRQRRQAAATPCCAEACESAQGIGILKRMAAQFVCRRVCLFSAVLAVGSIAMAQTPSPTPDVTVPQGKVLFNRDQDSQTLEKKAKAPGEQQIVDVPDVERASIAFTAYDLDVHIAPAQSHLEVHAGFTVKNSGKEPLTRVVLQISSSLRWEDDRDTSGRANCVAAIYCSDRRYGRRSYGKGY